MKEIYSIQSDVYQSCLWVFFGSVDECVEALRAKNVSEDAIKEWKKCAEEKTDCHGMYLHNEKENISLLWMDIVPDTVWTYGTMVHEIEHYVFYLFDRLGMEHTMASDEAYAYMMAYIFRQIDNVICELRSEPKVTIGTSSECEQTETKE